MKRSIVPLVLAALAVSGSAFARAPALARPVPASLYAGRWYEVARTPNLRERGCIQVTSDFTGMTGPSFLLAQTCVRRSGAVTANRAPGVIVPGSGAAKFKLGLLGGLVQQEYWVLDVSLQADWAILATPGGHYVWLLSRRPQLPAPVKAAALARIAALGYPTVKLEGG